MNEEKVIEMLLDHGQRIKHIEETMATKEDLNRNTEVLDEVLKIVKETQQEMVMMRHGMSRMQTQVDRHEEDIIKIKPLVGLV